MNTVEPIRDKAKIDALKKYLKGNSIRDYLLFVTGISSALRVSDLLKLKIKDIWDGKKVCEIISLKEKKTGKYKQFPISKNLEKAIREYVDEYKPTDLEQYVFFSRQGTEPLSRSQAFRILKNAAQAVGIKENIGTHSMRKTWGYWAYKQGYSLALLSDIFNHSSEAVTRRYIGISQEDRNEVYINLNL